MADGGDEQQPNSSTNAGAGGDGESLSLWLEPPAGCPNTARLAAEVAAQAAAHAAEGAPLFEPHVTLLGGIEGRTRDEAVELTRQLAGQLKPLRLNFLDVATGGSFHQCVFVLVAKEPALLAAAAAAERQFGHAPRGAGGYMPHLSLLYADLDAEARARAAQASVARLYGEGATYATLLTDAGFEARRLSLWHTPAADRSLASWTRVAEFELAG